MLGWDVTQIHPALGTEADSVVKACKGADLFLWSRSYGHVPRGDVEEMLHRIEDGGTVTASQHMDLYWGVKHREPLIGIDPFWKPQWVFTADGGHQKEFAARGVNHVWCPPAIGSRWLGRGHVNHAKYRSKYIFVGGFFRPAHGQHRAELLRWARHKLGPNFEKYGRRNPVWGYDLNDLYTTAHLAIGDSAPSDYYWSDRVVHTLGRGGMLAHPKVKGMASWGFTSDVMILYGRAGFSDLGRQIAALTPERRMEMSDAALTLIGERHLWKHRLLDIQKRIFG